MTRCATCGDYVDPGSMMTCSCCGSQMCSGCSDNTAGLCGSCFGTMGYNN